MICTRRWWYTLELEYARVFRTLLNAGFCGFVSIEMEGAEDAVTAMPKSVAMLRDAWSAAQNAAQNAAQS